MNIDSLPNLDVYLKENLVSVVVLASISLILIVYFFQWKNAEPGKTRRKAYRGAKKFYEAGRRIFDQQIHGADTPQQYQHAIFTTQGLVFTTGISSLVDPLNIKMSSIRLQEPVLESSSTDIESEILRHQATWDKYEKLALQTPAMLLLAENRTLKMSALEKVKTSQALAGETLRKQKSEQLEATLLTSIFAKHLNKLKVNIGKLAGIVRKLAGGYGWLFLAILVWACDVAILYQFLHDIMIGANKLPLFGLIIPIDILASMLITLVFAILAEMFIQYLESNSPELLKQAFLYVAIVVALVVLSFVTLFVYLALYPEKNYLLDLLLRLLLIPLTAVLTGLMYKLRKGGAGFDIFYAPLLLPVFFVSHIVLTVIDFVVSFLYRVIKRGGLHVSRVSAVASEEVADLEAAIAKLNQNEATLQTNQRTMMEEFRTTYDRVLQDLRSKELDFRSKITSLQNELHECEYWLGVLRTGSDDAVADCALVATKFQANQS